MPDPWTTVEEELLAKHPQNTTIGRQLRILVGYRTEYELLQRQLAAPPEGWFTFGHHVTQPDIQLEFWGDHGGIPIWERPISLWTDAKPGEVWDVRYVPDLFEQTGFRNVDGIHSVYEANGGRRFFAGEVPAKANIEVTSDLIQSARRIS